MMDSNFSLRLELVVKFLWPIPFGVFLINVRMGMGRSPLSYLRIECINDAEPILITIM